MRGRGGEGVEEAIRRNARRDRESLETACTAMERTNRTSARGFAKRFEDSANSSRRKRVVRPHCYTFLLVSARRPQKIRGPKGGTRGGGEAEGSDWLIGPCHVRRLTVI